MIEDLEGVKQTLSEYSYELKKLIGSGSYGSVYLCYSQKYKQEFAIKIMNLPNKDGIEDDDESNGKILSFEQAACEIHTLLNLSHPNIISMYNYFKDDKHLYVVLEYCNGDNLQNYVEKNGPFADTPLISLTRAMLLALSHCHNRNIVHRDIKPANILLDKYGRARLADFGISDIIDDRQRLSFLNLMNEPLTMPSNTSQPKNFRIAGSLAFMPPESQTGTKYDLKQADIWSLGITFYFFATGNLPWSSEKYVELLSHVKTGMIIYPPSLNVDYVRFLKRMLVTIPKKRAPVDLLLEDPIFSNSEVKSNLFNVGNNRSQLHLPNFPKPQLEKRNSAQLRAMPSLQPLRRKMSIGPAHQLLFRGALNNNIVFLRKPSLPEDQLKRGMSAMIIPKQTNF